MLSPTLTRTRVTSPPATFSPSSGTLNSVMSRLAVRSAVYSLRSTVTRLPHGPCRGRSTGSDRRPKTAERRLTLRDRRVRFLRIAAEILDRFRHHAVVDLALARELV